MLNADICIAGAGVIGLSLALELQARNLSVAIIDAGHPLREASSAAAGMLAAEDPHNPAESSALSLLSASLYPEFLDRLKALSGLRVPFQTCRTLQASLITGKHATSLAGFDSLLCHSTGDSAKLPPGFCLLNEHSLDPQQLATALLAAVEATSVRLIPKSPMLAATSSIHSVIITTPHQTIEAAHFIDCTGAWTKEEAYQVVPIKGQMLAVTLPADFALRITVRTSNIYIVPRTSGPNAGRAVIGATIEDLGFDKTVHATLIEGLRQQATVLLPQLENAVVLESWSGLRPATPDRLPILGAHPAKLHHWVATGHYRNGILLAPATARVMTQLLLNEAPATPLAPFDPARLSAAHLRVF